MSNLSIQSLLESKFSDLKVYKISTKDFVFEERVKQKCFHCENYNSKWTCPGHLPNVNYKKLFEEYENAVVIEGYTIFADGNLDEARYSSTNRIHKALLYLEAELYKRNNTLALSFIGGSCKLCKNGCRKDRCANPTMSRVPWEATGCNVVSTLKKIGIDVVFPPNGVLYRYGLFLW